MVSAAEVADRFDVDLCIMVLFPSFKIQLQRSVADDGDDVLVMHRI